MTKLFQDVADLILIEWVIRYGVTPITHKQYVELCDRADGKWHLVIHGPSFGYAVYQEKMWRLTFQGRKRLLELGYD